MNVIAFNGSPRKDGNTAILVNHVFAVLRAEGIECEIVQLAGHSIRGCTACMKCRENRDERCVIEDDIVNSCIEKDEGSRRYYYRFSDLLCRSDFGD